MILTQCAVCATDLGLTLGKKCGRCSTRYCGPECQVQHWKDGGHDNLCKQIKKAGGAEQYNADQRYAKAVSVAAEECAEDTKGQTCFICTQALHWKTKEGLVRGCACRGTAGFAHVSCLAEQAKILIAEAEENNLGNKVFNARVARWYSCSLCEQQYHGAVRCALGWACWKTYVGRPEEHWTRRMAMTVLGNGLNDAEQHEAALSVYKAELAMERRLDAPEASLLNTQSNLAMTYAKLGESEQALQMRQEVYYRILKLHGEEDRDTLIAAGNHASCLLTAKRFDEAKSLLSQSLPVARRVLGESHQITIVMRSSFENARYLDPSTTLNDHREAVVALEEVVRDVRRVLVARAHEGVQVRRAVAVLLQLFPGDACRWRGAQAESVFHRLAQAEAAPELVRVFGPLRAHALVAGSDTHGRTPAHVAAAAAPEPHVRAFFGA